MNRKSKMTECYPGDMTLWMFEEHPGFDYHRLQFLKRYEIECREQQNNCFCSNKEKDKSKEFAFI